MASLFKQWTHEDVAGLIADYPLALVVSASGADFHVTPLPMLTDRDAEGRLVRLVGHMALLNPHVDVLRRHPRAQFLFLGPHGYISPRLLSNRAWGPTWNYAVARVEADVRLTPEKNDEALRRLVAHLETGREGAWSVEELGERYERMAQRIIAFEADVRTVDATFKLGQDEKPGTFEEIVSNLESAELREWMRLFRR